MSCKKRNFDLLQTPTLPTEEVFSISDLAVLFPPAATLGTSDLTKLLGLSSDDKLWVLPNESSNARDGIINRAVKHGFWPALVRDVTKEKFLMSQTEERTGKTGYLDLKIFEQILGALPNAKNENTQSDILKYVFQRGGLPDLVANMAEPERWRITSFRFEPCPLNLVKGHSVSVQGGDKIIQLEKLPAENVCRPEIRLVAKPVLGIKSQLEAYLARNMPDTLLEKPSPDGYLTLNPLTSYNVQIKSHYGWVFGDNAIHLCYHLSTEEAKNFVSEMHKIKLKHQNLCHSNDQPLKIHSCLAKELFSTAPGLNANSIKSILQVNKDRILDTGWNNINSAQL